MENKEMVILVNENDEQIGIEEKLAAHIKGQLHRAISVFIFNSQKKMLIQQRAFSKYHSGGLWTNACCSHPQPGETTQQAAERRLQEEMGIKGVNLQFEFSFKYFAQLNNELTEHELDHVFMGLSDALPVINTTEVCNYRYLTMDELELEVKKNEENFTYWFKLILPQLKNHAKKLNWI